MCAIKKIFISVPGCLLVFATTVLFGNTYTVTNTHDAGDGSLRQAIIDANNHFGNDLISFQIPTEDPGCQSSEGIWSIKPITELPTITDHELTIDGATQALFIGTDTNPEGPEIELNGSLAQYASGLSINANGVNIFELVINGFSQRIGVFMQHVEGGCVSGCYIGTDAKGMTRVSNHVGISIYDHSRNVHIKPRDEKFNIISGNPNVGVAIADSSMYNFIFANRIGVNRTGQDTIGNGSDNGYGGVYISDQSDSNQVFENWICGNRYAGVLIDLSCGNTIAWNLIGTNPDWSLSLGNIQDGVWIRSLDELPSETKGNVILGNQIGYNGSWGVMIDGIKSYGNLISQNNISLHGDIGIFLSNGSNSNIAAPEILFASNTGITGQTGAFQTIEVFCDDDDEGKIYLGETTSDSSGSFSYQFSELPPLRFITATATDTNNNTSSFSYSQLWESEYMDQAEMAPGKYSLEQNYPNPFNSATTISYELPIPEHVILQLYDSRGREVEKLVDQTQEAGCYHIQWDGSRFASGVYILALRTDTFQKNVKMLLFK